MILLQTIASIGMQDRIVDHVKALAMRRLVEMLEGAERVQRAGLIFGYLVGGLMIRRMTGFTPSTRQCRAQAIQRSVDA